MRPGVREKDRVYAGERACLQVFSHTLTITPKARDNFYSDSFLTPHVVLFFSLSSEQPTFFLQGSVSFALTGQLHFILHQQLDDVQ